MKQLSDLLQQRREQGTSGNGGADSDEAKQLFFQEFHEIARSVLDQRLHDLYRIGYLDGNKLVIEALGPVASSEIRMQKHTLLRELERRDALVKIQDIIIRQPRSQF